MEYSWCVDILNCLTFFIWSYELEIMAKKKVGVIFQFFFSPRKKAFLTLVFHFIIFLAHIFKSRMQGHCKYIYVSTIFQWYKEHLIWTKFTPCIFLSNTTRILGLSNGSSWPTSPFLLMDMSILTWWMRHVVFDQSTYLKWHIWLIHPINLDNPSQNG